MHKDGYYNITNMDISRVVLDKMRTANEKKLDFECK